MSNVYPDTCKICGNPSRKLICSNSKCKSWRPYRKMANDMAVKTPMIEDKECVEGRRGHCISCLEDTAMSTCCCCGKLLHKNA